MWITADRAGSDRMAVSDRGVDDVPVVRQCRAPGAHRCGIAAHRAGTAVGAFIAGAGACSGEVAHHLGRLAISVAVAVAGK